MSDDLLQLIFAAILVLFGLLGGTKKKKPTQRPPAPPRPRPQPSPRATARPAPQPRPVPAPAPTAQRDALVRELERLLGAPPVEVERHEELPEAVSLEATDIEDKRVQADPTSARWTAGLAREAVSLETLEEAGASSHQRFHARLAAAAEPAVPLGPPSAASSDRMITGLRRAVIWNEILGPPVSMR